MTNLEDLLGNSDNDLISLNGLVQNLSQELFITLMHETITPPNDSNVADCKIPLFHNFFSLQLDHELGPKIAHMNYISNVVSSILQIYAMEIKQAASDKEIPAFREFSQRWDKEDSSYAECTITHQPTYYRAGDLKAIFRDISTPPDDIAKELEGTGGILKELRNSSEMMQCTMAAAISKTPRCLFEEKNMVVANGWQPPRHHPGSNSGLGGGPN